jgi:hypothetical protein
VDKEMLVVEGKTHQVFMHMRLVVVDLAVVVAVLAQ